jgi:hypothetical protein
MEDRMNSGLLLVLVDRVATVAQRFASPPGTPAFDHWATHPQLELDYLGNFTRLSIGREGANEFGAAA